MMYARAETERVEKCGCTKRKTEDERRPPSCAAIVSLAVAAFLVAGLRPALANDVQAGIDLFQTPPGFSFTDDFNSGAGGSPIPADFFDPGSDPFDGRINLEGDPFPFTGNGDCLAPADTIVERLADAPLPVCPTTAVVPIEIVALSLVSSAPITVTFNGGLNPEQWDVKACLSDLPQSIGQMIIQHECDDGGTFISDLPVLPKFIFTRQSDNAVRILDAGVQLLPPTNFNAFAGWVHQSTISQVTQVGPGAEVDGNCDGVIEVLPVGTSNFVPGIFLFSCLCSDPPGGQQQKELTTEQAQLAAHGVLPAQDPRDDDGDGIPDDCVPPPKVVFPKWTQLPHGFKEGFNVPSDIDWQGAMAIPKIGAPNWVVADDFRSDGRPITCVRWWGSHITPFFVPDECVPTPDFLDCEPSPCAVTTEICQPKCVTFDPTTGALISVDDCECRGPNECHVDITPGAVPACVGGCPPGQVCVETLVTNPDGSVTICCDCQPEPECGPDPLALRCLPVTCPIAGEDCLPTCVTFNNTDGTLVSVDSCECMSQNDCHVDITPGAAPSCVGGCPPGETCVDVLIDNGDGTSTLCCECQPDQPEACPLPDPADPTDPCRFKQLTDCLPGDPTDLCLTKIAVLDAAGNLVALRCACFKDDGFCGPVQIDPGAGGAGGTVSCPGICPPALPPNCVVFIDGVSSGQSSINVDPALFPAGTEFTCDCAQIPRAEQGDGDPMSLGHLEVSPYGFASVGSTQSTASETLSKVGIVPVDVGAGLRGPGGLAACCVGGVCIGDLTAADCTAAGGTSFPGETCQDFVCPQDGVVIDGWLLSFHTDQPVDPADPNSFSQPLDLLGLYFCREDAISIQQTPIIGWDQHEVFEYFVELQDCWLVHSFPDPRIPLGDPGSVPAQPDAFLETQDFIYWLDIQAVVGHTYVDELCPNCICDFNGDGICDTLDLVELQACLGAVAPLGPCAFADLDCDGDVDAADEAIWNCLLVSPPGVCCPTICVEVPTNNHASEHFWGWHTSHMEWNDNSVMGEVQMGAGPAGVIINQHHFRWWDSVSLGGVVVTDPGDPPPAADAIALFDVWEYFVGQDATTTWYAGGAVPGLPASPFAAAPIVMANAELYLYEIENISYDSGNGPAVGPPFTFTTPVPPGPGVNGLSGINIIDGHGALAAVGIVAGSQFISEPNNGLDTNPLAFAGSPWAFQAFAGPGNFEWDIRPIDGAGILLGQKGLFGYAMPAGKTRDDICDGWAHSWNAPPSIQVNIANGSLGFSCPRPAEPDWFYVNWQPVDGSPHMLRRVDQAFQLLTPDEQICKCIGDINGDGVHNGLDMQGFVDCLLGARTSPKSNCECADINGDGLVDTLDIPPFAALLASLIKSPCP